MPYETFDLHFEECEHTQGIFRPAKESESSVTFWQAPASMRAIARSKESQRAHGNVPTSF